MIFHPGLSLDAYSFAVAFISLKIVVRKISLTESLSYITVAGQMAGNIIQIRSASKIFSCKFCEVFQKRLSQSASWLTASYYWQRFRRTVSSMCVGLPQIFVFKHFRGLLAQKHP